MVRATSRISVSTKLSVTSPASPLFAGVAVDVVETAAWPGASKARWLVRSVWIVLLTRGGAASSLLGCCSGSRDTGGFSQDASTVTSNRRRRNGVLRRFIRADPYDP